MNDCISRKGVSAWLDNMGYPKLADAVMDEKRFPAVVGHWYFSYSDFLTHCSVCGQCEWRGYVPTPEEATEWMPICPKCGADLKAGKPERIK